MAADNGRAPLESVLRSLTRAQKREALRLLLAELRPAIVGTREAAELLEVERPRIGRFQRRGVMPEPIGSFQRKLVLAKGSAVATVPKTTGLFVGMGVEADGLPQSTAIESIDSKTQVTLTAAAEANGEVLARWGVPGSGPIWLRDDIVPLRKLVAERRRPERAAKQ